MADRPGIVWLYPDGSAGYQNNVRGPSGIGLYVRGEGISESYSVPGPWDATSNQAEVLAVECALRWIAYRSEPGKEYRVVTDCDSVNQIRDGVHEEGAECKDAGDVGKV